jgi:hypothetical protein
LSSALILSLSPPALSQIHPRRASAAAHSPAFPDNFPENPGQPNSFPAPFRSAAARYNLPQSCDLSRGPQDPAHLRLHTLGTRGLLIEEARQTILAILATENSCSAWFREADPDAAAIFESLNFSLYDGPKEVVILKSASGELLFKHPYSAGVQENAGLNATVLLNLNGAFFTSVADILGHDSDSVVARFRGRRELHVGPYAGNTLPARITTLLHELGHVIGRLPDDSDELSGLSELNTQRVLHACHAEIKASTRQYREKASER